MFNNTQRGANMLHTILRLPDVLRERGRSRSAHYLDIQQGLFTIRCKIGIAGCRAGLTTEVAHDQRGAHRRQE
jgi:hypothetical protein